MTIADDVERLFSDGKICIVTSRAGQTWICFAIDKGDDIAEIGMSLMQVYIEREGNDRRKYNNKRK